MINIPRNVNKIIETLQNNSHDAYVVGGCVRDTLMGKVPGDWDITTDARPEDVKKLFRRTFDSGIEHGTVTVLMGKGKNSGFDAFEVTTYRIDGDYSDHRRPDSVIFSDDLIEDLKRRDFTINAMAYNSARGLVDEFDGQGDLDRKLIRCVGDANERFEEDALRMLRAVRFSARLDFDIEKETAEAIRKHAADLKNVSAERIFSELSKTLTSDHPEKLREIWNLGLAPGISESFALIKNAEGAVRLQHAPWAGLMRHLAPEDAGKILKELKSDNETVRNTTLLVAEYKKPLPVTQYEIKKCLGRIGPELFADLMLLKKDVYPEEMTEKVMADAQGIVDRKEPYRIKDLAIDGNDIIGLGYKGREVGEALGYLLDTVMQDPSANTKEKLAAACRR